MDKSQLIEELVKELKVEAIEDIEVILKKLDLILKVFAKETDTAIDDLIVEKFGPYVQEIALELTAKLKAKA